MERTVNYNVVSAMNGDGRGDEIIPLGNSRQPTILFEMEDGSTLSVTNKGGHIEIRSDGDHRVVVKAEVSNVILVEPGDF